MRLSVAGFAGVAPKYKPFALADGQAQVATDCRLWTGALEALPDVSQITTVGAAIKTIYRFGHDLDSETQYWFAFTNAVAIAKGMVAGDTAERTYWTGDGVPKMSYSPLAITGGSAYPVASYQLGVPAPANPLGLVVSGSPTAGAITETRAYIETYVTANGEDGPPGDATTCDVKAGQTVQITAGTAPAGNFSLTLRRLWRTSTGNNGTNYYLVAEVPIATLTYNDTKTTEQLGEVLPSLSWNAPPAGLQGLVALPNGILAGFVGKDIHFCEPFRPHAWPPEYALTVDYEVVALGEAGGALVVLTKGAPSMYRGAHPSAMAEITVRFEQACVSARSVCKYLGGIVYASPDGQCFIGPNGESEILTEPFFTETEWRALKPSSMQVYQHDKRLYGFYDTGTVKAGWIFDPKAVGSPFAYTALWADAGFQDLQKDALYILQGSNIKKIEGAGTLRTYTWRSKAFVFPAEVTFARGKVIAHDYVGVTLKIYVDGVLRHTEAVTSGDAFPLPDSVIGRQFELELTGTSSVLSAHLATTTDEFKE